jgi:hypothetical protein
MKRSVFIGIVMSLLLLMMPQAGWAASEEAPKETSKGLKFFYRIGERVDRYLLQNVDTNYITLPEHSWRLAFTSGLSGVNFSIHSTSTVDIPSIPLTSLTLSLYNRTAPSVDLGFYAGYRGFGFGYSWDIMNAYARRISFSFGSKFIGLDFEHRTSTNVRTDIALNGDLLPSFSTSNSSAITNSRLNVWYALNSAHYSHNAAIKQSYIQRKTAGSFLLHLTYLATQIAFSDTVLVEEAGMPTLPALMSGVSSMTTRQIAIGLGYGINYTPNHGKVLLHAAASAMLVCYSINHIAYYLSDSIIAELPGEPMYALHPSSPVHVTGNVRAAVSWEINKWVHLALWARGDNIRFRSEQTANENELYLSSWNWQVHLNIGVRLGAGKKRVHEALKDDPILPPVVQRTNKLPKWITDYFYSPAL